MMLLVQQVLSVRGAGVGTWQSRGLLRGREATFVEVRGIVGISEEDSAGASEAEASRLGRAVDKELDGVRLAANEAQVLPEARVELAAADAGVGLAYSDDIHGAAKGGQCRCHCLRKRARKEAHLMPLTDAATRARAGLCRLMLPPRCALALVLATSARAPRPSA
jgi:hypothetical protein